MAGTITINYQGVDTVLSVPSATAPASIVVDGAAQATMIAVTPAIESPVVIVGNPTGPGSSIKIEGVAVEPVLIVGRVDDAELPDLDKMTHPAFGISRKIFETGQYGISKISVLTGGSDGVLLFTRTITYDSLGRASMVVTDCALGDLRMVKTITYGVNGDIANIKREIATWR